MSENEIYNLSFTAGAAMLVETHAVAEVLIECDGDWNMVKDRVFAENIIQKNKKSSTVRYCDLIKQRMNVLIPEGLRRKNNTKTQQNEDREYEIRKRGYDF